jgi:sigma-B regulation protein RsbU (phosphoserine phosphatase)
MSGRPGDRSRAAGPLTEARFEARLAELVEENARLRAENEELRRLTWGGRPQTPAADDESTEARMRRDLWAAARIQRSLLPDPVPQVAGLRFAWAFEPCAELAGDNLNVLPLDDEHVALYVLDVSGHGVSAALLAVTLHRVLSTLAEQNSLVRRRRADGRLEPVPPAEVAACLNREFRFHLEHRQYFTLLYGVLSLATRRFRFVSGGHWGPIHVAASGRTGIVHAPGFPIGVFEDTAFEESEVQLAPGDRLFLYTDGIPEALSPSGEIFDYPRIESCLAEWREHPLERSLAELARRVAGWTGRPRQEDDISVLAVELVA